MFQGKPTKASRTKVMTLLKQLIDASAELSTFDMENPDYDHFDFPVERFDLLIGRIQTLLSAYAQQPYLEIAYNDRKQAVLEVSYVYKANRPIGEQLAVWDIIELQKTGHLELVRQCGCDTWFFANRADQRACSAGCRHKTYEQTDAFKVKRREYMRNYYALKQSGKVK